GGPYDAGLDRARGDGGDAPRARPAARSRRGRDAFVELVRPEGTRRGRKDDRRPRRGYRHDLGRGREIRRYLSHDVPSFLQATLLHHGGLVRIHVKDVIPSADEDGRDPSAREARLVTSP